jgi:hypothetical protein
MGDDIFRFWSFMGVLNGVRYNLSRNYIFSLDCSVEISPRFCAVKLTIHSWAQDFSRSAFIELCKEAEVAGNVTRNTINALTANLFHRDREHLDEVIEGLRSKVGEKKGVVDVAADGYYFKVGSLKPSVESHTGTARRVDGFSSWVDEDARSRATYFNAPIPPYLTKEKKS